MLTLTRKIGESIRIGDNVVIVVKKIGRNHVQIGIEAPRDIKILREELFQSILANAEEGEIDGE
ncbi:carbon storage regulator [Patescibacteria group bacterium]|nr:carbon storage regulator [Patescibacteria group bacterium]MBU1895421.1 carbon storage regulator [Patescibacteria group bacterium]